MISDTDLQNLTTKKLFDPKTGKSHIQYFWKRKQAPVVVLKGPLADRLSGYSLIQKDLQNAKSWMDRALELISDIQNPEEPGFFISSDRERFDFVKGLFVAALTFYGKSFTTAQGRKTQLNIKNLDDTYREAHAFYMNYRHSFAAHSGDDNFEHSATRLVLIGNRKNRIPPLIATTRFQHDIAIAVNDEISFSELIAHAVSVTEKKYNDLSDHIMDEFILIKDRDFWERIAKSKKSYVIEGKRR